EKAGLLKEAVLFYKRNRAVCWVGMVVVVLTLLFIAELQRRVVETRNARDLAEAHRREAEAATTLYRDELTRNMHFLESMSVDLEAESYLLSRRLIYSDPVPALELAIQRSKFLLENEAEGNAASAIQYCYFIKQDFAQVIELYESQGRGNRDLYELSREYVDKKDGELLPLDQLSDLLTRLGGGAYNRRQLLEKMLAFDYAVRKEKTGYEKPVRAVLAGWNRRWTHGRFEYDPQQSSLLLRGDQLKEFAVFSENTSGESPLRFMSIKIIDAQGTGLNDLGQINTLHVQELDIRRTKVTDLSPVQRFPALKKLIVSRGRFLPEQLGRVPERVQVLER
uniref:hypothetical protein n=1 Tax=Pontiella sp. TaxID=2837462 RepID=UPI003564C0BB